MAKRDHPRKRPSARGSADTPKVEAAARVWLEWNGTAFIGHGRVTLLEAIDKHGSITQAARAEGISYRAAWRWIDLLNRLAGQPLVRTATGGRRGGGAQLTPMGKAAVAAYRLIEARTRATLERASVAIARLFAPPKGPAHPAPRRPRRGA